MSVLALDSPLPGAPRVASPVGGTIRVRERVIDKVVREAAATVIGVPRDAVSVDVTEWGGALAVRVSAKLPIPDLSDSEAIRVQVPLLERARILQLELADGLGQRWLRDVAGGSGAREVLLAGERHEVFELAEEHGLFDHV